MNRVLRPRGTTLVAGALALGVGAAWSVPAWAQSIGYGGVSASEGGDFGGGGIGDTVETTGSQARTLAGGSRGSRGGGNRAYIRPYIEAAQVVRSELTPGNDTVTYSVAAAGFDAGIDNRRASGSVSMRYERRFGFGRNAEDSGTLSGVGRGSMKFGRGVRFDAAALAAETRVEGSGSATLGPIRHDDSVTQIYSIYAGPSVTTRAGDVKIDADYKIGYSRVEAPNAVALVPGQTRSDVFDDSVSQSASLHAGVKPGDVLPVGLGAGATYQREDISNLDQRVTDFAVRGDVTVPVGTDVHLVAGVGYEEVEVSNRDVLRDADGDPVRRRNGRFVVDKGSPRVISYDTSGFIWDAGVIWRPSRRMAFEAHVGRRYGSTTYYGSLAYAPNARSSINIAVYDNMSGFGGQLSRTLGGLPTQFQATRNPLSGDIGGCLIPTGEPGGNGAAGASGFGNCLPGALGSVQSAVFRSRGVQANYSMNLGSLQTGIGAGFDRRRFLGAKGTILETASGTVDKNAWLVAYLNGQIDQRSAFMTNLYVNWYESGDVIGGDNTAMGASAAYSRYLTNRLTATAAIGLDGLNRDAPLDDAWVASALLGMRYSF